jgi:DtxR family Mn-dependent transcriptional regulator
VGEISPLAQNYLLTLYMMGDDTGSVTMSRLAEQLAISPATEHLGTSLASVAGMIRRMKRDGLVDIVANKEIVFTEDGRRQAESMMRRHQLAEYWLVNVLGMELHKVHAEAHRLEHAISPEVEDRLAKQLGNPERCPFGHAIPGGGYRMPADTVGLNRVKPGVQMVIERIPEDDPRLVQYLVDHKMVPGAWVTVVDVAAYRGTITLAVDSHEVVVGLGVAPRILVHPVESSNGKAREEKALAVAGRRR